MAEGINNDLTHSNASREPGGSAVLTLNGGSSSIKFAVYNVGEPPARLRDGVVERVGSPGTMLRSRGSDRHPIGAGDPLQAAEELIDWLDGRGELRRVAAVGHRVVNGGPDRSAPQRIDRDLVADLSRAVPLDPVHLPGEIALMEAVARRRPDLPQVACFDTTFHDALPRVARLLPIPRRYESAGLRRYGFHGLSYGYLMGELRRAAGPAADGRVILAHLGSGASLAAVRGGACIDTTMAFTPAAGLMMGTRTGDIDPGVLVHLMRTEGLTADRLDILVNRESGLLGVSETSSDVRDLLVREATDDRAADAVALFCYQVRKFIGAMAAALGGIETLVFSGGIGENAPEIRARVCDGLDFLGVRLDPGRNARSEALISDAGAPCGVRVIRTDEEVMIARTVALVLGLGPAAYPEESTP
jgi:acetate kinase